MTDFDLTVGNEKLRVSWDKPKGSNAIAHIVTIHGAGKGTRHRTEYIQNFLQEMNCHFVRFDHSGHGDSTGTLEGSTLQKRLDELRAVIDHTWDHKTPLVLIGNSMGGFEVAMLAAEYPVAGLIMIVPAAYDSQSMNIPFGESFRDIIRAPGSYKTSPSFDVLKNYNGRSVLVIAGQDDVIPTDITDRYAAILKEHCSNFQKIIFPNATHVMSFWFKENPKELEEYFSVLRSFIFSTQNLDDIKVPISV